MKSNTRKLAEEIAKALFTNGAGEHAERLVLEIPGAKRNGGGWCERAVADVVEDALEGKHRQAKDGGE